MRNLLCFLMMLGVAGAESLEMRQGSKTVARYTLSDLKAISPAAALRLDNGAANYWTIPMGPLLSKAFGKNAYGEDITFVFVCSDGYRSPVKAEDLKKYPAYLAFATSDGKPFVAEGKKLDPFYLVWDTQKYPALKTTANWPYQVVAIERATFSQAYSAVLPPPKCKPEVTRGFQLFRKHCLSCHQINGQGGFMGVDLNSPSSVTEYIQKPYLSKLIDNPSSVRNRATMPPLAQGLPNRKQAIADIIAYLEAKAAQRRATKAKPSK
jgi:mono/diheme cytochrome c family protein